MKPRAIMCAVDYSDALALSLAWNLRHFSEIMVVTSHADAENVHNAIGPAARMDQSVRIYVTDAFYRHGAHFAKWLALEEALDVFGRHGVMCLMDADVLWPKDAVLPPIERGFLYSPLRRMFPTIPASVDEIPPESEWKRYPLFEDYEHAGYTQLFDASDETLGPAPWHETNWSHAGGADSAFQAKWPPERKIRPAFEVLHVGSPGRNWCGRATPYADGTMDKQAPQRLGELAKILTIREMTGGEHRFDHEKIKTG